MKRGSLVLVPVLALLGCGGGKAAAPKQAASPDESLEASLRSLSPDEVEGRIAAKDGHTFVYDNNGQERYAKGHVPGARWVDSDSVTADVLPPDKGATLIFYCANEL